MPFWTLTLLLAAIAPPLAGGEPSAEAMQPLAAVAFGTATGATIGWVPGSEPPDFFRIYGVQAGGFALLALADAGAMSAEVEGKFPQYAVTAVRDGVESDPALAIVEVHLLCVTVDPGIPPGYGVDTSCAAAKTSVRGRVT